MTLRNVARRNAGNNTRPVRFIKQNQLIRSYDRCSNPVVFLTLKAATEQNTRGLKAFHPQATLGLSPAGTVQETRYLTAWPRATPLLTTTCSAVLPANSE